MHLFICYFALKLASTAADTTAAADDPTTAAAAAAGGDGAEEPTADTKSEITVSSLFHVHCKESVEVCMHDIIFPQFHNYIHIENNYTPLTYTTITAASTEMLVLFIRLAQKISFT